MGVTNSPVNTGTPIPPEHKKVGPIAAVLVVVLLIIVAALYFFALSLNKTPKTESVMTGTSAATNADTGTAPVTDQSVAPVNSTADDPQSLSNDLEMSTSGTENLDF